MASSTDLEGEIQGALHEARVIAKAAVVKLSGGSRIADELARLKGLSESVQINHLLLQERFQERRAALEGSPLARQQEMEARYLRAVADFTSLIDHLPPEESLQADDLQPLLSLLDDLLPRRLHPLLGTLPYKNLNYPAREPVFEPTILPAYKGGVTAADTQGESESSITPEIAALAESLGWNPVRIYDWVQANIETEWYWGSMKGAQETLRQRSGNDADQAALLVALLQAADFPARYVQGVIEFFPGIEQAKNLTGLEEPLKIAAFFQKAGIPFAPVVAAGRIANFRIEHIWVETEVPYSNYRGAVLDNHGKVWIALDTHLKPAGYAWNQPQELAESFPLDGIRDAYLMAPQSVTPLEYLQSEFGEHLAASFSDLSYDDHLRRPSRPDFSLDLLPASLQFNQVAIIGEYTALPADLIHRVAFKAAAPDGSELFTYTTDAADLSNRKVSLFYEPETVQDQQLIDSYGGLDNTPSYLVRLRPVLMVDGERRVVAREGLPMGSDYTLSVVLASPNGAEETVGQHVAGNLASLGIVAQRALPPADLPLPEKDAEHLLHEEALRYIERWNAAEDELASLLKVEPLRPIPTVVTVGGVIDVTYLLDTPHGFAWKGLFIDAGLRRIETVSRAGEEFEREFMRLSALQGSVLESRLFEEDFEVEAVSTAKLLGVAAQEAVSVLTLDGNNLDAVLPTLDLAENIQEDIRNAVHQGYLVKVPEAEIAYRHWTGVGYLKEDPETGEAGYMLSGMIAGGMTADEWANQELRDRFLYSFSEPANRDPQAAARIVKIPAGDKTVGIVGQVVEEPIAVLVVDLAGRPVAGAAVTFTVLDGGGSFEGTGSIEAVTGENGVAKAWPLLGTSTEKNSAFLMAGQGDTYPTQVGTNLFTASVQSEYGALPLAQPFTLYGRPDRANKIVKKLGDETWYLPNNPAGTVSVDIVDQYDNPVSNIPVTFSAGEPVSMDPAMPLPAGVRNIEFYDTGACPIAYPLYGECGSAPAMTELSRHYGASMQVLLGNTLYTKYTVEVSAPDIPSESFTFYTNGQYLSNAYYLPPQLLISALDLVNEKGELVDAAKAGDPLKTPLSATMFLTYIDHTMEGPYACTKRDSGGEAYQTKCWNIKGDGIVRTRRITDGTVDFTAVAGDGAAGPTENPGDGTYRATYTTGKVPAFNVVEAIGEATLTFPEVLCRPDGNAITEGYETGTLPTRTITLKSGTSVVFDPTTRELYPPNLRPITYGVYGVDVPTAVTPEIVFLGEGDLSRDNITVLYAVEPAGAGMAGYNALSAQLDLLSVDATGQEGWAGYLVGDATAGTGRAVFFFGTRFDPRKTYFVQMVLNRGTDIEIRGEKVPLSFAYLDHAFMVDRVHLVNEFDITVPVSVGSAFVDGYHEFRFAQGVPSKVKVTIVDEQLREIGTLVPTTELGEGEFTFVVDYEQVKDAGFSASDKPFFYIQLERQLGDGAGVHRTFYPGFMGERVSSAKMLGQTMVHDVLIQDGSLNLSREDFAFQGRGPQLAFSRSYNNQFSPRGHKPLGKGWSHSLDLRLEPLASASASGDDGPVPDWVKTFKGKFYTDSDLPQKFTPWSMVQVNGTVFKRHNGSWHAERSKHGSLKEVDGAFVFTAKDGTRYVYDYPLFQKGTPVRSISDRNGNRMSFTYDERLRLATVTDAVGRACTFRYDDLSGIVDEDRSRLRRVECPDDVVLSFDYNTDGYLQSVSRADRVETYEYAREPGIEAGEFNLVKATDSNNRSFEYRYHALGELHPNFANFVKALKSQDVVKQVIYPDANAATFRYDVATANKRIVTDLRGFDTTYTLNYLGNPTSIEEPLDKVTQMTWSIDEGKPDNVMTSRTVTGGTAAAPALLTTLYEYDPSGNIKKETDPYGRFIETTWNQKFSLPTWRRDRNGVVQEWGYDEANGNLLWKKNGDLKQTDYTYFATGEVETTTDPRRNTTRYTYDQYGNPDKVTGPEGSVTDFDYDVRGRKVAETEPNRNRTTYAYDALDYPSSVTYPALTSYPLPAGSTQIKTFDYDPVGNLLSETDRVGLTLEYEYTPRNQVKSITRKSAREGFGVKRFDYDENGNLTSETDWKGVATTHHYDELNRRDSTTNRLGDAMSMGYDLAGNLTRVTDYEGRVTDYVYDKLNRQTDVWQPALPGQERGHLVKTYYNEADPETNLKSETDAEGRLTTYEYNGRYLRTKRINALLDEFVWEYDDAGNLEREIDEELNVTRHAYDKQNRRTFTYRTLDGREIPTRFGYDPAGNRTHVVDPRGNITRTDYDQWNRPWKTSTPVDEHAGVSYTTTAELDGEGREIKVTDGRGHSRTFLRDARGLVLTATDAEQQPTVYTYDLNGNVETITNARGFVTRTTWDAEDRRLLTTEAEGMPEGRITGIVLYDKVGNPRQVRDGNGNVRVTEYNALNLPWKQYDPAPFNAQFVETLYDKTGKVKSMRNRRGFVTLSEYDALGRLWKVTDPAPFDTQTIVTTYDKVGNVRTVKDKRGIVSETIYDDLYRPAEQRRAGIRLLSNEYDDVGNLTATVDAENRRTEYAYNSRNLLERTTYLDGYTTEQFYDGAGNVVSAFDEERRETVSTYDKENRLKTVTFAGETTENFYDPVGNLAAVARPKGNRRAMAYDGLGRLTSVTDGSLLTTRYEYDGNGNLRTQTDPRGNLVEFTYDALNRKTQHIQHKSSGNLTVRYDEYDAEGNLRQLTDAKGQVFTYAYDELNRQTKTVYPPVATPFLTLLEVTTTFDANNNVETVTETKQASGGGAVTDTTVNLWDDFDRLDASIQRGITIDYGYDANGNRTSVATVNGSTVYTFDQRNRLQKAIVGADETVYAYTPAGRTDTITYPNGTSAKYTYWPTNRVETITHKAGETVISSFAYQYDLNGNRTQQIEAQGANSETTDYAYDTLDRLERFTLTAGANVTVTGYTFDGYNRKTETVTEKGTITVRKTYDYDETNWLTQVVDRADPAHPVTIGYQYDANGNTVQKTAGTGSAPAVPVPLVTTFDYDAANRLVQTTQGAILLGKYDYNAQGMRTRHYGSERGDIEYYYDDGAVLEEYVAGANGGLLAHYRYGDRLLSLQTGTETQYYHHDALGSTVNLTGAAGAVKVRYTLDPWGQIRGQVGTSVNRQIFTGQEHDEQTGLIYFGARYYDPDSARFITQDSYLGEPGTPPSLHRYLYAYSNPTVYVDLDGHSAIDELGLLDSAEGRIRETDAALEGLDQAKQEDFANGNDYMGWKYSAETVLYGGYRAGLVAAQGALNVADYIIDVATLNTQNGEQKKRTLARMDAVNDGIESAIDTGEAVYRVTKEDPAGVASKLVSYAAEKTPMVVQGVKETLGNVYYHGKTKETAAFAGVLIGSIEPAKKIKTLKRGLEAIAEATGVVTDTRRLLTEDSTTRAFKYYLKKVDDLDVSTGKDQAVFYSGAGQREIAEQFARENGRFTLEMTKGGEWLDQRQLFNSDSPLSRAQAREVWKRLSERYAQQASGNTFGFISPNARPNSIYNSVEYPALRNNSDVTNHITGGN